MSAEYAYYRRYASMCDRKACGCSGTSATVRYVLSNDHGMCMGIAIHADRLYFDALGVRRKHLDRWCEPSLFIMINNVRYIF